MPAVIVEIAEAIKEALNDATLSQAFTAERAWVPVHDVRSLTDLTVTVVPSLLTVSARDLKPRHDYQWEIGIWIQKKAGRAPADVDPLMLLSQEIIDLFRSWRVADLARCIGIETRPVLSPEQHDAQGIFTTVVTLIVRVAT